MKDNKDSLFEILMLLVEKTLTNLKEIYDNQASSSKPDRKLAPKSRTCFLKAPHEQSFRILNMEEQNKISKSSYQFLTKLITLKIIGRNSFERIMDQLLISNSAYVTLPETKWIIRKTLAPNLKLEYLAFLDLILYNGEDGIDLH